MDSYIKYKRFGAHFLPDYTRKTDDLYDAYTFAQQNHLNASSLISAHTKLTQHLLQSIYRGVYRSGNMFVVTKEGKVEYVATAPEKVPSEMEKLLADFDTLLAYPLSFEKVFFFSAFLHLLFVKIHPFEDGNGRTARLLEKWFWPKSMVYSIRKVLLSETQYVLP